MVKNSQLIENINKGVRVSLENASDIECIKDAVKTGKFSVETIKVKTNDDSLKVALVETFSDLKMPVHLTAKLRATPEPQNTQDSPKLNWLYSAVNKIVTNGLRSLKIAIEGSLSAAHTLKDKVLGIQQKVLGTCNVQGDLKTLTPISVISIHPSAGNKEHTITHELKEPTKLSPELIKVGSLRQFCEELVELAIRPKLPDNFKFQFTCKLSSEEKQLISAALKNAEKILNSYRKNQISHHQTVESLSLLERRFLTQRKPIVTPHADILPFSKESTSSIRKIAIS